MVLRAGQDLQAFARNYAFTGQDGQEHPALEAVEVFIDDKEPVFLLEDDSGTGEATGRQHTMVIKLLDENDKPSKAAPSSSAWRISTTIWT